MSLWPMDQKTKEGYSYPPQGYYPDPNATVPPQYPDGSMPPQYPNYPQPTSGNPLYPPQPYHTQSAARTLKVDFTSWTTRHLNITDAGNPGSAISTVDIHTRKPQLVFKSGPTDAQFATVEYRSLKPEIDIKLHGRDIHLRVETRLKHETTYPSIAFPNTYLTWKSTSAVKYLDFECIDENGVVVAKFNPHSSLSMKKLGQLDILVPSATQGAAMDELMLTGVAFMYYVYLMHIRCSGVAAGVASNASVAAAVA
ncbi:hypothetical protein BBP40_009518 [Aspergillus hancockii]|nr:hypothetical protein BBP40_009518 [Aspergillus hancockii]